LHTKEKTVRAFQSEWPRGLAAWSPKEGMVSLKKKDFFENSAAERRDKRDAGSPSKSRGDKVLRKDARMVNARELKGKKDLEKRGTKEKRASSWLEKKKLGRGKETRSGHAAISVVLGK